MWSTEHTLRSSFPPESLWPLLADPARWPEWDDAVERAALSGPLVVLFARVLGRRLARELPAAMRKLAAAPGRASVLA